MTSVKRISPAHTTPAAQVTLSEPSSSTLPRRIPGASGHRPGDNGPVIPKIPGPRQPSGLAPRPTPPRQRLTARPLGHDLDWNGHIPSAPGGSFYGIETGTYTRTGTGYGALAADRAFGEDSAA